MMSSADRLLAVARAYAEARGVSLATVSTLAANDGKVLGRLEAGRAVTTTTFDAMLVWFSRHWPDTATWPVEVERPDFCGEAA